jgi:hypothetical protein
VETTVIRIYVTKLVKAPSRGIIKHSSSRISTKWLKRSWYRVICSATTGSYIVHTTDRQNYFGLEELE